MDQKVRLSAENVAEFQNETFGTFEQGQRVFPIQQWRFGLFNFSLSIPAVNIFKKVWCQLCRTIGNIKNCRPA